MPRDRSSLTLGVLVGLLVLVSVLMIAFGLPEQTLLQRRLLRPLPQQQPQQIRLMNRQVSSLYQMGF